LSQDRPVINEITPTSTTDAVFSPKGENRNPPNTKVDIPERIMHMAGFTICIILSGIVFGVDVHGE